MKNIANAIRSWPVSCSTLASYNTSRCQHNGRWLLSRGYDGHSLMTTDVVWRQSRTWGTINVWTCFYLKFESRSHGGWIWLQQQNLRCQLPYIYSVPWVRLAQTDGQTDGQTPHDSIGRAYLCIALRGNNKALATSEKDANLRIFSGQMDVSSSSSLDFRTNINELQMYSQFI